MRSLAVERGVLCLGWSENLQDGRSPGTGLGSPALAVTSHVHCIGWSENLQDGRSPGTGLGSGVLQNHGSTSHECAIDRGNGHFPPCVQGPSFSPHSQLWNPHPCTAHWNPTWAKRNHTLPCSWSTCLFHLQVPPWGLAYRCKPRESLLGLIHLPFPPLLSPLIETGGKANCDGRADYCERRDVGAEPKELAYRQAWAASPLMRKNRKIRSRCRVEKDNNPPQIHTYV